MTVSIACIDTRWIAFDQMGRWPESFNTTCVNSDGYG